MRVIVEDVLIGRKLIWHERMVPGKIHPRDGEMMCALQSLNNHHGKPSGMALVISLQYISAVAKHGHEYMKYGIVQ